jgi:23S rRNA (adenine2503-C2)-methyltransferase
MGTVRKKKAEVLMHKTNILTFGEAGLKSFVEGLGMPGYRAAQIARWIYAEGKTSFEGMTNLSKADRERLSESAEIRIPELLSRLVSSDGAEKYLFGLEDGETVESVLIPDEKRVTLCISSQAGCALGCRFCLTGAGGFRRDLTAHEITGQVFAASGLAAPQAVTNIVMMGMGEPLLNRENVFEALRRLTSPRMFGISTRKITLSTAGVVPALRELGESGLGVNLAVSLNAATDEVRDKIMPINKKYPIKALMAALKAYPLPPRRRITIEYVLIGGVNDSAEDAKRLAKLLRGLSCKVNLIPYNEHEGSVYKKPEEGAVLAFQEVLKSKDYTAFIRESMGADILAACGQLRAGGHKSA